MVDLCKSAGFRILDTLATLIFVFRGSIGFTFVAAQWFASAGSKPSERLRSSSLPSWLHDFDLFS
jgi:hypothetical protein